MKDGFSVVIPAFNEQKGISAVITEVLAVADALHRTCEVLVVNDGSHDETPERVRALRDSRIRLLEHTRNRGYGAALKTGFKEAAYETVVIVDADRTYPLKDLKTLLAGMDHADMVVGARTGAQVARNVMRSPAKWFLRKLASYLAEQDIPDLNSGFRVIRRSLVLEFMPLLPNAFSFTSTITLALLVNGYVVNYVPINYFAREGSSKIRPVHAWQFLLLIIRTVFLFNPMKIMYPLALWCGGIGFLKLIYDITIIADIGDSTIFLLLFSVQLLGFGLLGDLIVRRTS